MRPNPTFSRHSSTANLRLSSDPLRGWNVREVLAVKGVPLHDLYGKLYVYLEDVLKDFLLCLEKNMSAPHRQTSIVSCAPLEFPRLHRQLFNHQSNYDAIDISTLCERLGVMKVLRAYRNILRYGQHNNCAFMIGLFADAVRDGNLDLSLNSDAGKAFARNLKRTNRAGKIPEAKRLAVVVGGMDARRHVQLAGH